MRHILRKGDMDCGIACIAMLAGVGYFEALKAFNDKELAVEKGNLSGASRRTDQARAPAGETAYEISRL